MKDYWVGKDYGRRRNLLNGWRLMILGEAHYSPHLEIGAEIPDMTPDVVRWHIDQKKGVRFFKMIERLLLKQMSLPITKDTPIAFWSSVVFANYIPVNAARGPRQRPPEHLWDERARERYREIIWKEDVDAILVCGKDTYWHTPTDYYKKSVYLAGSIECSAKLLHKPDEMLATAVCIPHPSGSFGWSYERCLPAVNFLRLGQTSKSS